MPHTVSRLHLITMLFSTGMQQCILDSVGADSFPVILYDDLSIPEKDVLCQLYAFR